jgi:hypothetical protein
MDLVGALRTNGEEVSLEDGDFVRKAVLTVKNAVDAGFRGNIARAEKVPVWAGLSCYQSHVPGATHCKF